MGEIALSQQDLAIIQDFYDVEQQINQLKEKQQLLRADLVDIMEDYNIKSWETDLFKVTYIAESKTTTFDSSKFKKQYPDIAKEYQKETTRKASVRVTLKDK